MKNIFVYGSLMYDRVWNSLISEPYQKISAKIIGYKRLKIKNEEYPGLVRGKGIVEGFVWLNVSQLNIARLDRFEGNFY